ncbi:unnamed protein product, partial [Pleuronectes platessa]
LSKLIKHEEEQRREPKMRKEADGQHKERKQSENMKENKCASMKEKQPKKTEGKKSEWEKEREEELSEEDEQLIYPIMEGAGGYVDNVSPLPPSIQKLEYPGYTSMCVWSQILHSNDQAVVPR